MILESAQLLCTAHRVLDGEQLVLKDWRENTFIKATHVNHPCAIWCRQTDDNYSWLANLAESLLKEYTRRYKKQHAYTYLIEDLVDYLPDNIPEDAFTEPPQCMPDYCKIPGNTVQAYRNYYINEKSNFAVWKYTQTPDWYLTKEKQSV